MSNIAKISIAGAIILAAAFVIHSCNRKLRHYEHAHVTVVHTKDHRFCYEDKPKHKVFWLGKTKDALKNLELDDDSLDFYRADSGRNLGTTLPRGYIWAEARTVSPKIAEEIEEDEAENVNVEAEEVAVTEDGSPATESVDADGNSTGDSSSDSGSSDGGDAGGGDGGGGDGGGGGD